MSASLAERTLAVELVSLFTNDEIFINNVYEGLSDIVKIRRYPDYSHIVELTNKVRKYKSVLENKKQELENSELNTTIRASQFLNRIAFIELQSQNINTFIADLGACLGK